MNLQSKCSQAFCHRSQQINKLTTELAFLPPKRELSRTRNSAAGMATAANAMRVLPARTGTKLLRLGFSKETPGSSRAFSNAREMALPLVPLSKSPSSVGSGPSSSWIFCDVRPPSTMHAVISKQASNGRVRQDCTLCQSSPCLHALAPVRLCIQFAWQSVLLCNQHYVKFSTYELW